MRDAGQGKEIEDAKLSQADRDFEKAARSRDFAALELALKAGADPNRVFTDTWREKDGCRAYYLLCEISQGHAGDQAAAREWGRGHARAMQALVEAGADFSLPALMERAGRGAPFAKASPAIFKDRATCLWESHALPIESCVWFAKGGGDFGRVFGDVEACAALHSRQMRPGPAEDVLGPMWEVALRPKMEAGAGKLRLLTETLGSGWQEWSKWLIEKGARPAERFGGGGALGMLALETIFYANPSRSGHCGWDVDESTKAKEKIRMESEALECARLAVELGEDPNAQVGARAAPLVSLLAQPDKHDPKLSMRMAGALVELGAKPIDTPKGRPFLACALGDPANASAQLDFALELGVDPKDRAREAVAFMLSRAGAQTDGEAARAIERLAALGSNFSQGADEAGDASLLAGAARRGLWWSLKALAGAGADAAWRDPKTGATLASLAAHYSVEHGGVGCAEGILRWLASQGAPMDELDGEGLSALHRAAKALDVKLCEVLLQSGADVNKASGDKSALTPSHLACARFEKRKEKAQLKVLELLAAHGADFAKLDGKKRSAMEVAAKKGFLSVVQSVADKAKGAALDGDSGTRAAKQLAERGEGFFAVAEESALRAAAPEPHAKRARRSL